MTLGRCFGLTECWRGVIGTLESNLNGPCALEQDCGRLLLSNKINILKLERPFFDLPQLLRYAAQDYEL